MESSSPAAAAGNESNAVPTSFDNLFDLTGSTAIVTGGCGTLGTVFARALGTHHCNVVVLDLPQTEPQSVAQSVADECCCRAIGIACDIKEPEQDAEAVAATEREFGGIDVLVNNAASKSSDVRAFFKPAEEFSLETWREVMAVNLDGLFVMARDVGRSMIARKAGGSIVQISSVYGTLAPDPAIYEGATYQGEAMNTPPVYSASKAGIAGLTRYLAVYWAKHDIRVNTVSPGGVSGGQNETFRSKYGRRVPLRRMAEAHELAGTLVFLASKASSYVTGQNIIVDGGLSIW